MEKKKNKTGQGANKEKVVKKDFSENKTVFISDFQTTENLRLLVHF